MELITLGGTKEQGAGTTGLNKLIGVSGLGQEKISIVKNAYSGIGTVENRSKANYSFLLGTQGTFADGGAEDLFREFMGKYWTKTTPSAPDGATGVDQDIIFLNPVMGKSFWSSSWHAAYNIPGNMWVSKAKMIDDAIWPEYEQTIIIDPDMNWLQKTWFGEQAWKGADNIWQASTSTGKALPEIEKEAYFLWRDATIATLAIWSQYFDFDESYAAIAGSIPFVSEGKFPIQKIIKKFTPFEDYSFRIQMPIEASVNNELNADLRTMVADIKSEYNFYVNSYEKTVSLGNLGGSIKENILPNMYAFISAFMPEAKGTGTPATSKKFKDLITLNGLLPEYDTDALAQLGLPSWLEEGISTVAPPPANDYFRAWALAMKEAGVDGLLQLKGLESKYSRILFPMQDTGMLKHYNKNKFMFPMYNDLSFSTDVTTTMGDLFRATKLSMHFMKYYILFGDQVPTLFSKSGVSLPDWRLIPDKKFVTRTNKKDKITDVGGNVNALNTLSSVQLKNENMKVMNLEPWLADMGLLEFVQADANNFNNITKKDVDEITNLDSTAALNEMFNEGSVFITKNENEDMLSVDSNNKLERTVLASILYGKIRKIGKSFVRGYDKLSTGKLAYSETLMYKVEKYAKTSDGKLFPAPMQTFYFLNSSEIDILKFVDTQVTYNKKYLYRVHAVQLVVGTTYQYTKSSFLGDAAIPLEWGDAAKTYLKHKKHPFTDTKSETETSNYYESDENPNNYETKDASSYTGGLKTPGSSPVPGTVGKKFTAAGPHGKGVLGVPIKEETIPSDAINMQDMFDVNKKFEEAFNFSKTPIPGEDGKFGSTFATQITVRFKPDYKIVETLYTELEGRVLDKPPVFPDVLLTPYKGVINELLISLNSQVGSYYMDPITFSSEEEGKISDIRDAQKALEGAPILYSSDDPITSGGSFQIFRMEERPKNYKDFSDKLIATVNGGGTSTGIVQPLEASSTAYKDAISPNKKYYYTFRVTDAHGHVSNPSPIFEIKMVDDSGIVYLIQNIVELEKEDPRNIAKTMKRYFQVKPTLEQTVFNADAMDLENAESAFDYGLSGKKGPVVLGEQDESVWGKKYKIRFTSRSSGKQIDLNVDFKLTHNTTQEKANEGN